MTAGWVRGKQPQPGYPCLTGLAHCKQLGEGLVLPAAVHAHSTQRFFTAEGLRLLYGYLARGVFVLPPGLASVQHSSSALSQHPEDAIAPHSSSVQAAARFTSSPAAANNDAFVMCCLISMEHESQ